MSDLEDRNAFAFDRPGTYRIRVLGVLDEKWAGRIGGLQIMPGDTQKQTEPVTELLSRVRDQAELSGILETIYELHLTLVSVELLEAES
jgi:hypothetical protein